MIKYISFSLVIGLFSILSSQAQNVLPLKPVTTPPSEYPVGTYLMGAESDSPFSWLYDGGVIFGLKPVHTNYRHTQLIFNGESNKISIRSKNGLSDSWTGWRRILTSNQHGHLGIGTSNPSAALHVIGDGRSSFRIYNSESTTNYISMWQGSYGAVIDPIGTGVLYIGGYDVATKVIMAQKGGNVGIGVANPDVTAKLHVAGTIRAEEIKVKAKTADFVFEEDYQLKSLEEVEQFVKERKHLPGIASAKKMEEEGVGLAEMNKLLLQKIEELTLYNIQQNKRMKQLEEEINSLKQKSKD
ncbi:hypothetical protein EYV94_21605 [Puteibacter caeruleilacunae]|nr:hypothetical protein EYV94_21605 [Puteibacter caeruleilacunae]